MNVGTFFLTLLTFSSAEIIRNHDLSEFSAEFSIVIVGRAVGTTILLKRSNIDDLECLLACVHHLKCKSVNYNQKTNMCELLATNAMKNNISCDEDWVFVGTPDNEKVSAII